VRGLELFGRPQGTFSASSAQLFLPETRGKHLTGRAVPSYLRALRYGCIERIRGPAKQSWYDQPVQVRSKLIKFTNIDGRLVRKWYQALTERDVVSIG